MHQLKEMIKVDRDKFLLSNYIFSYYNVSPEALWALCMYSSDAFIF